MPKKIPQDTKQLVIDLYTKEHKTLRQVGQLVGLSPPTVSRIIKTAGNEVRTHTSKGGPVSDEARDEMVRLYLEDNMTNEELLRAVGHPKRVDVLYSTLRSRGIARKVGPNDRRGRWLPSGTVVVATDGYVNEKVGRDWKFWGQMGGTGDGSWIRQHRKVMAEKLGVLCYLESRFITRTGTEPTTTPTTCS